MIDEESLEVNTMIKSTTSSNANNLTRTSQKTSKQSEPQTNENNPSSEISNSTEPKDNTTNIRKVYSNPNKVVKIFGKNIRKYDNIELVSREIELVTGIKRIKKISYETDQNGKNYLLVTMHKTEDVQKMLEVAWGSKENKAFGGGVTVKQVDQSYYVTAYISQEMQNELDEEKLLKEYGIKSINRIIKKNVATNIVKIELESEIAFINALEGIYLENMDVACRWWLKMPSQCNKCGRFTSASHEQEHCHNTQLCLRCGEEMHGEQRCVKETKCILCSGSHPSYSPVSICHVKREEAVKLNKDLIEILLKHKKIKEPYDIIETYSTQKKILQNRSDMSLYVEEKIKRIHNDLSGDISEKLNKVMQRIEVHDDQIDELNTRVTTCESLSVKTDALVEKVESIAKQVAPMLSIERMMYSLCEKQGINVLPQ